MELTGKIKVIFDEKTFPSGFSKREFVITTDEKYPNDIMFELLKDKGSLINPFQSGDLVKVSFDLRGKEYNGRYYNSVVAWKIEAAGAGSQPAQAYTQAPPLPPPPSMDGDDDLPF